MKALSDSEADELLKGLLMLTRSVQRVLEDRVVEVSSEGLSHSKVTLLRDLDRNGPQSPKDVAKFLNVSRPAVSQIAAEMIEQGLVVRMRSSVDSRRLYLEITAHGSAVVREIELAQRHLIRKAAELSPERSASSWIESVNQLTASIVRADERCGDHCYQCGAYSDGSCILIAGTAECSYRGSAEPR